MTTIPEMSSRERALLGYFYEVATDPVVKAAGFSVTKLKTAILHCVEHDLVAVLGIVLHRGAEAAGKKGATILTGATSVMLGGVVSEKAAGEIAKGVGLAIEDASGKIGEAINAWLTKQRPRGRKK